MVNIKNEARRIEAMQLGAQLARNLLRLIIADAKEVTGGDWVHSDEAEAEVEYVECIQRKAEKALAALVEVIGE